MISNTDALKGGKVGPATQQPPENREKLEPNIFCFVTDRLHDRAPRGTNRADGSASCGSRRGQNLTECPGKERNKPRQARPTRRPGGGAREGEAKIKDDVIIPRGNTSAQNRRSPLSHIVKSLPDAPGSMHYIRMCYRPQIRDGRGKIKAETKANEAQEKTGVRGQRLGI